MDNYDCIVIGAGYAGLVATRTLVRAGKKVLLLEAHDRVGGRSYTCKFDDGSYCENGAGFLSKDHTKMVQLAKEYGIETFDTNHDGRIVQYYRNQRKTYKGVIPALRIWELIDIDRSLKCFEKLAQSINLEELWKSPNAEKWDTMTFDRWLYRSCKTNAARDLFKTISSVLWGVEATDVSMLYALWYTKSNRSLTHLLQTVDGAQEIIVKGGTDGMARKIHEELASHVKLNEPVEKISRDEAGVTVQTYSQQTFRAKKLICTVPVPLIKNIHFSPPLPAPKRLITEQFHLGAMWKCHAFYQKPFWRGKLSGEATSPGSFLCAVFDVAPPEGTSGKLLGFIGGHKARQFAMKTPEERRQVALEELAIYFGEEARNPYRYHDYSNHEDEWAWGGPVAIPQPGAMTTIGRSLREPVGNIHWAGSEYAVLCAGYMDGAVRSGEQAAAEVLTALTTVT